MKGIITAIVSIVFLLFIITGPAFSQDMQKQICASLAGTETMNVVCIPEADFIRSVNEWAKDQPYWPFTESKLTQLLQSARANLGKGQALVADHAYRLHIRDIEPLRATYQWRLKTPLPKPPDTLVASPSLMGNTTELKMMADIITTEAGGNTGGDLVYGPPGDGGPLGWTCQGFQAKDECKNCCMAFFSASMAAVGAAAIKCHSISSGCPWCHVGCGVVELAAAGLVLYAYDSCRNDHCEKQYWNDQSINFSGATQSFMLSYGWGEISGINVRQAGNDFNSSLLMSNEGGEVLCQIPKQNPLYDELLVCTFPYLCRVAYDGSYCNVRDYRILSGPNPALSPVPLVGFARFDETKKAWFMTRKGMPELQILRKMSKLPFEPKPSWGWTTGVKIGLLGDIDESTQTIKCVAYWTIKKQARHHPVAPGLLR